MMQRYMRRLRYEISRCGPPHSHRSPEASKWFEKCLKWAVGIYNCDQAAEAPDDWKEE
jgi:hypothetical protein